MKNSLVISDTGPIFSLATINQLSLLTTLFKQVFIPQAVWIELTRDKKTSQYHAIESYFSDKVREISGFNELNFIMDYGESEAVILFKEMDADFLLIDDKKARKIAETLSIKCVGTIGLLTIAKEKGHVHLLRPLFKTLLENKRFYSLSLLNAILTKVGEPPLT